MRTEREAALAALDRLKSVALSLKPSAGVGLHIQADTEMVRSYIVFHPAAIAAQPAQAVQTPAPSSAAFMHAPSGATFDRVIAAGDDAAIVRLTPVSEEAPCPKCGQFEVGQTGEYHCSECGLPTVWDEFPERMTGAGFAMSQTAPPAAKEPMVAEPAEKWCLFCDKDTHRTDECWSTQGLNTPPDRELMRLARAATPPQAPAPDATALRAAILAVPLPGHVGHLHKNGDFCLESAIPPPVFWPVAVFTDDQVCDLLRTAADLAAPGAGAFSVPAGAPSRQRVALISMKARAPTATQIILTPDESGSTAAANRPIAKTAC